MLRLRRESVRRTNGPASDIDAGPAAPLSRLMSGKNTNLICDAVMLTAGHAPFGRRRGMG